MEVKQVIIIRKDLKMRRGKEIAQASHASMKVLLDLMYYEVGRGYQHPLDMDNNIDDENFVHMTLDMRIDSPLFNWITNKSSHPDVDGPGFKKVCVYVNSEEELLRAYNMAKEAEIPCALITDSGKTEFHGVATNTVVAIGPDLNEKIDPITGHMKLL